MTTAVTTDLQHSPSEVIRQLLINEGQASDPDVVAAVAPFLPTGDWPIYESVQPSSPDECITINTTLGTDAGRTMIDGEVASFFGFQLRFRAKDDRGGTDKANALRRWMQKSVYADHVTMDGVTYLVPSICGIGQVLKSGRDRPNTGRWICTLNAQCAVRVVEVLQPPDAPTRLTLTAGSVILGWHAPAGTVTGYKVYRGTSSGGETLLVTLGVVTAYEDTSVSGSTTYYYQVAAFNDAGTGSRSSEASITTAASGPGAVASIALWTERGQSYSDLAGTVLAVSGDSVALKKTLKTGLPNRSQATSGNRPVFDDLGVRYTGGTRLLTGTAVTLTGKFTAYSCGWNLNHNFMPFGTAAGNAVLMWFSNAIYAINDVGSIANCGNYTGWPDMWMARWRRDVSNHVFFKAGGMAEVDAGVLSGNVTFDSEGGQYSGTNYTIDGIIDVSLLFSDDLVATGDDASIVMPYLLTKGFGFGATLTNMLILEGDSIVHGFDTPEIDEAYQGWHALIRPILTRGFTQNVLAVGGQTLANIKTGAAWNTYGPTLVDHDVVVVAAGTNDNFTSQSFSDLKSICNSIRSAWGAGTPRILVQTGLPCTARNFEAARQTFNASIRNEVSPPWDAYVDVGNDSLMGQAGDDHGVYYGSGHLHPNALGHSRMATVYYNPAINALG